MSRNNQNNDDMIFVTVDAMGHGINENIGGSEGAARHYDAYGHEITLDHTRASNNAIITTDYYESNGWITQSTRLLGHEDINATYDAIGHRMPEENRNTGNSITHHYDANGCEIHPNRRQNNHPVNSAITTYYYGSNGEITETT